MIKQPVILFVPVSSAEGVGEYARSIIIADELKQIWPQANIHFILNKQAPYSESCPYQTHLSDCSATKNTPLVKKVIDQSKPDLVIFDCSGRGEQFKYARRSGAKVIFISQHRKKRARGLKLSRLLNTDLHWVVQPDFAISELSAIEKLKLKIFKRPAPRNIGPVFSRVSSQIQKDILHQLKLTAEQFYLFNAGSGGHFVNNKLAADIFYQAAVQFQNNTQLPCLMVFGANYPEPLPDSTSNDKIICISSLTNEQFIALLDAAKGRVISAGDTILQTIQMKKPSVAAAVSKDQPARLETCDKLGVVISAKTNVQDLLRKAEQLSDSQCYQSLENNMNQLQATPALDIVIADIKQLLKDLLQS